MFPSFHSTTATWSCDHVPDGAHHLLGGFDTARLELDEQRDGQETNLTTGARTNVILGEHFPVRDFPLSSMETFGAFLADRWTLPSGRAVAHLGVRYDHTRTSTDDDPLYQATLPGLEIVDADFSAWTPRAGATLDLGRGHSAYVALTEGYRAPPVYDTDVGLRLTALGYEALPNPNLRPERSRGFELGWRYAGSRLSVHLAAYHNRYRDPVESRALIGRDPLSGITCFQSINRDRATVQGVDGWIQAELGTDAVTGGSWTATVALSAAEGRDTRRHVALSTVDPATVTTTVGWRAAHHREDRSDPSTPHPEPIELGASRSRPDCAPLGAPTSRHPARCARLHRSSLRSLEAERTDVGPARVQRGDAIRSSSGSSRRAFS